jgi:hypothetical protein
MAIKHNASLVFRWKDDMVSPQPVSHGFAQTKDMRDN